MIGTIQQRPRQARPEIFSKEVRMPYSRPAVLNCSRSSLLVAVAFCFLVASVLILVFIVPNFSR